MKYNYPKSKIIRKNDRKMNILMILTIDMTVVITAIIIIIIIMIRVGGKTILINKYGKRIKLKSFAVQ